ncbi:hypothetical protein Tco_0730141 [Tanacetum coccineum]|uniref:BED-type domain-containing protein n=1 Tax=Tanacetum coccineum TaxID=301880 RepID=A0ABQ4YTF2_9ASTR
MSSGPRKARCKKCGAVFKEDGSTTLKNHRNKSFPALKVTSGSSQRTMGIDGSLWLCEAARVRERMAHFVIQETLPFDHFDNKQMTSLIQETFQPRYCHAIENVVENESHFSLEVPVAEEVGVETVDEASIVEGEEEDGLGGDGFVVDGGRSPNTSSKDGEDGGVENKSSMGSRLIVTGEIVVEWLLEKLVGLPMCSLKVERMVDREKKKFLD